MVRVGVPFEKKNCLTAACFGAILHDIVPFPSDYDVSTNKAVRDLMCVERMSKDTMQIRMRLLRVILRGRKGLKFVAFCIL